MSILNLVLDDFEKEISAGLVLVDFWAEWCAPCRSQSEVLEELDLITDLKAKICKLNVDQFPAIPSKYEIHSIPTLVLFKNGNICETLIGFQKKETLLSIFSKHCD